MRAVNEAFTKDEKEVVMKLAEAWNAFLLLPTEHSDDVDEFRRIIHAGQEKVMARPARRALNRYISGQYAE